MLAYVPQILNFGFLGLSFLMVYLGYRLTRTIVQQTQIDTNKIAIARFFLKIALVFMLVAGPLQWVTIAVTHYAQDNSVILFVGANNPSWEREYGEVYMSRKGELKPISHTSIKEEFFDEEEIRIELSEVVRAINKMRSQISKLNEVRLHNTRELKDTLGEG